MSGRIWTKESAGKNLNERVWREESENRFHCTVSTERVTGIFERFRHVKVGKRARESTKRFARESQAERLQESLQENLPKGLWKSRTSKSTEDFATKPVKPLHRSWLESDLGFLIWNSETLLRIHELNESKRDLLRPIGQMKRATERTKWEP